MRRPHNEDGFAIAWAAILLTVLLGVAGLAIDLGNWYIQIDRSQRAADAAAKAGAPYLPGDPDAAQAAAKEALARISGPARLTSWDKTPNAQGL